MRSSEKAGVSCIYNGSVNVKVSGLSIYKMTITVTYALKIQVTVLAQYHSSL